MTTAAVLEFNKMSLNKSQFTYTKCYCEGIAIFPIRLFHIQRMYGNCVNPCVPL